VLIANSALYVGVTVNTNTYRGVAKKKDTQTHTQCVLLCFYCFLRGVIQNIDNIKKTGYTLVM